MFIPLGDDNSRRHRSPVVVTLFILSCLAVWFLQLQGGDQFTAAYSAIPLEIVTNSDLVAPTEIRVQGESLLIPQAPGPRLIWLTLFTAMFMHGSWMHIIGNMLYLFIFGDQIEDLLGHFRFVLFYLLCGLSAGLAHVLSDPESVIPSLGASGAIAGVLGAYLVLFPSNRVRVLFFRSVLELPALVVLGAWFALQFLGQLTPQSGGGVAYMAHIGGFLAGAALIFVFKPGSRNIAPVRGDHILS
jgi:membrane associated rhomboid family serine protease